MRDRVNVAIERGASFILWKMRKKQTITSSDLTYQHPAPRRRRLSPPQCRQHLVLTGPVLMCSPWGPTGRPARWYQTEPPLRKPWLEQDGKNETLLTFWRRQTLLRAVMMKKNGAEDTKQMMLCQSEGEIPGAETCSGVVGTLRPPDSSSWVAENMGLSNNPRPENKSFFPLFFNTPPAHSE